jgi:hypothetical protein
MAAERFQVGNQRIQLDLADFIRVKRRHDSEPMSDLHTNGKGREWLIIEGWTQSGLSAGMALVTMSHKHLSAVRDLW